MLVLVLVLLEDVLLRIDLLWCSRSRNDNVLINVEEVQITGNRCLRVRAFQISTHKQTPHRTRIGSSLGLGFWDLGSGCPRDTSRLGSDEGLGVSNEH